MLIRFEHRRSVVGELWILTLPAGFEMSLQRTAATGAWAAFWFDDRGMNNLFYSRPGAKPGS